RFDITATRCFGVVVSSNTLRPPVPTRSSEGVRFQSSARDVQITVGSPTPRTCQAAPALMLYITVVSVAAINAEGAAPTLRSVQARPSGDVTIVPRSPTATNKLPVHVTSSRRWEATPAWSVQLTPLVDVTASPALVTATKRLPDQASPVI